MSTSDSTFLCILEPSMEKSQQRQLVAIMFTDMVGYTALMQKNEELALQKRARHRQVLKTCHQEYNGTIIQYFGDGTVSIFPNSYDAVLCAIQIQRQLQEPVEVPLRIGLHVGNVLIREDGIIGDAVNITSRIESFCPSGCILISDMVCDQVKNQPQLGFASMGEFNLKNVDRHFELFAISTDGIRTPKPDELAGKGSTIYQFRSNVPKTTSPIYGRRKEINRIIQLLGEHALVTITGAGGMGKTRLVIEICHRLQPIYHDAIVYVSMATINDATEVIPTLAAAMDITEVKGRSMIDGVVDNISTKQFLLVLDNLEHVIDSAQEIAELVSKCPKLKVLCTSRTPLRLKAEQEYALHTLTIPDSIDLSNILDYPAIQLFMEGAKKVNFDFELTLDNAQAVIDICKYLDGLPLAIELAAARIRILTPEKLRDRLERALDLLSGGSKDLPERHQTLRATINWSHSMLSESEKQLFRRLSVFKGGFTIEAAEYVGYGDTSDSFMVFDEVESLLDKGLLERTDDGHRFTFLQTINDFSTEQLVDADELSETSWRHATYFHKYVEQISKGVQGQHQLRFMHIGDVDEFNILRALDFLLEQASTLSIFKAQDMGLDICGNLWLYWHIRGRHSTAKTYINSLIRSMAIETITASFCKAYFKLHVASFTLGEMEDAKREAELCYEYGKLIGDPLETAKGLFACGYGYLSFDPKKARSFAMEGLKQIKRTNEASWIGYAHWQNGVLSLIDQDLAEARVQYSSAYRVFKVIPDYEGIGCSQSGIAMVSFITRDYQAALQNYKEALEAYERIGDRPEIARVLSEMAWTLLAAGNSNSARQYALDSVQAHREVGSMRGVGLSLYGLAACEAVEGNAKFAVEISAAAKFMADQKGIAIEYGINNHGEIYLEQARAKLSPSEIDKAEQAGVLLELEDILYKVGEVNLATA